MLLPYVEPDRELILLKIRNALLDKEACIANANMETSFRDGWSCNWNSGIQAADQELRGLFALLGA